MDHIDEQLWRLITRALTSEATLEERIELEQWLSADPSHRDFYRSIESGWNDARDRVPEGSSRFSYERGLQSFRAKIREVAVLDEPRRGLRRLPAAPIWKAAAAVLVLAAAGILYLTVTSDVGPGATETAAGYSTRSFLR